MKASIESNVEHYVATPLLPSWVLQSKIDRDGCVRFLSETEIPQPGGEGVYDLGCTTGLSIVIQQLMGASRRKTITSILLDRLFQHI